MSSRVVLFNDPSFETEASRVIAACVRLGMSWSFYEEGSSAASAAEYAVGFLPPGERRVPKRIRRALSAKGGRTPLLLLTRERLTQPALWLEGSLLVLMGDSPSTLQVASRLRMLDASAADHEKAGFLLREVRRPRFFAATFSNCAQRQPSPRMVERGDDWAALLPFAARSQASVPPRMSTAPGASWTDAFRENCGIVRLETKNGILAAHVPRIWGTLTVASPRRAPAVFRLPVQASEETQATLRTGSSDLLVALSSSAEPLTDKPQWAEALRAGAGAVLEFVEDEARTIGAVQGIVVEVL